MIGMLFTLETEEEQLLLVLRYDEEYSYKEIAREMKMRSGTVKMRLYRVYYEFYNPELEDKELSLHSQIYLYYSGDEEGSKAGRYAFTLENYAGDRVYEVDKYTKVYLSYLSVYISSTKQISVNMEAVMENGQRKKVFKSGDPNSGEGVTEDGGRVLSANYHKTFSKLFPVDQVKELYLNGKKLKEIKE